MTKDKVVEGIAEVLHNEGLDAYIDYKTMGKSAELWNSFRRRLAQAIRDSLVIDEGEIHKIVFSIAEQHFAPVTVGFKVDLATAMSKADIITLKGRKQDENTR